MSVLGVASSREDAWIETPDARLQRPEYLVASSREDAWIETIAANMVRSTLGRVLPRGRVD